MQQRLTVLVAAAMIVCVAVPRAKCAVALSPQRMSTVTGGCKTGPCGNLVNPPQKCNNAPCVYDKEHPKPCANCSEDKEVQMCLNSAGGKGCTDDISPAFCGLSLFGGDCEPVPGYPLLHRCNGGYSPDGHTPCGGNDCQEAKG